VRIASNKIKDVVHFFREELYGLYDEGEIETFIAFCFEDFINVKRFEISLKANDTINESELLKFNFAVKELKKHKPIQHILEKADFYGLKFIVNKNVLIPRPETEELVQLVVNDFNLRNGFPLLRRGAGGEAILDIGTGSGCIAIALKKNIPDASIYAIDVSEDALMIAEQNAQLNNVNINFVKQDILSSVLVDEQFKEKLDVIVSNPPYIRELERKQMGTNVLDYEPHLALFVPDYNPLVFYKAIANFSIKHLKPQGKLYLEINEYLGEETKELLEKKGFKDVVLVKDINGKNRILRGSI
jgi:release factor glutamine methyltransferase